MALPHYVLTCLPHTAFQADRIERSSDLVEKVFKVKMMTDPQSADGVMVLP